MNIESIYAQVAHITHRTRREYYVHGWEVVDWDQEGMLALYQLLEQHPELADNLPALYRYYKTKFRNRVIDEIRKQSNDKRKLNMRAYEDIHDSGSRIKSSGLQLDEYVLFYGLLKTYRQSLSQEKQAKLDQLLADERFKGRKAMLKELKLHFQSFA